MGAEQELCSMTRRHYQPKTATFERRSIPPAFVRRISRPIAERNTAGSCRAGGILAHKVLVTCRPLRVRRGAWPVTTRCDQRKPISLKYRSARCGLMWWNTPETVRRTRSLKPSAELMCTGPRAYSRALWWTVSWAANAVPIETKAFHSSLIRCALGSTASVRTRSASDSDRSSITAARVSPAGAPTLTSGGRCTATRAGVF